MKPRVKPQKGWKWRVILVNDEGHYFYDDFNGLWMADLIVKQWMDRYEELEDKKDKEARE